MTITSDLRIKAVEYYLAHDTSLRAAAQKFNIHYLSLFRWVKRYKENGRDNLTEQPGPSRPWNRADRVLENIVVSMKEQKPGISIRRLQNLLKLKGIHVSLKGIWGILKRYGLIEISNNRTTISYDVRLFPKTSEIKRSIEFARKLLDENNIQEAARIVNSLPVCPDTEILNRIPDEFLSLRRQVEKFPFSFGAIPFPDYYRKMSQLRNKLERNRMYYSAIRIGIEEALALQWMGKPKAMMSLIQHLEQKTKGEAVFPLRMTLSLLKGLAYASLFRTNDARKCITKFSMKRLTRFPYLYLDLTAFHASIGEIKKAICFAQKGLESVPGKSRGVLYEYLCYLYSLAGEYSKAMACLKIIERKNNRLVMNNLLVQAQYLLVRGLYEESLNLADRIINEAKKEQIIPQIHSASLIQSAIFSALGEHKKAQRLIKKYIPLLRKYKMQRDIAVRQALLQWTIPSNHLQFPPIRLISLIKRASISMRKSDYERAYQYAAKNGLMGIFHRFIFFYPQCIISLIEKGKRTGLPKTILRLPIFNKEAPAYHIIFLGSLMVFKNQKYLKTKLKPKDLAFFNLPLPEGDGAKKSHKFG